MLNHTGFMARPIHCVVITKKDIRGVAPAHSSEEPWCSPRAPPGLEAAQRGSLSKSLAQKHSRALRWPRLGPGRSHQGSQVRTALIAPAETMSGNDALDLSASNDNSYIIQHLSLGCTVISSLVGDPQWLSDGGRTIAGPHFVFEKCSCFHDIASKEGRRKKCSAGLFYLVHALLLNMYFYL